MKSCAALVLAAGLSRRMTDSNKLTMDLDGRPLISHCLTTVEKLNLEKVVVVTGLDRSAIDVVVQPFGFDVVHNDDYAVGMGSSLACGARVLEPLGCNVFVCLADMPLVRPDTYRKLAAHLIEDRSLAAVQPMYQGKTGHPVLFAHHVVGELMRCEGDRGGRAVLEAHSGKVRQVPVDDRGVHFDIDTHDDLSAALKRFEIK